MNRRKKKVDMSIKDDYSPLGDIIARYSTSKAITPDLPIEEPDNSLSMGDEHLDTTPSIENLVPIPSEFEGISDDTSDVPNYDNNRVNVEIDFVESLIDRDTSIVLSLRLTLFYEEFAGEYLIIFDSNSTREDIVESEESDTSLSHLDNSLPEFETFSDHNGKETRGIGQKYHSHALITLSRDYPDFEDSRALGFVHFYIRASYPQLHLGNPISLSYRLTLYGYQEKNKNKDKTGRNQARDLKERKKTRSMMLSDFIGPARNSFNGTGQPILKLYPKDQE
ncbi:hypothetical protein Tco_0366752 [Tanacetum coccineum]